MMYYLKKYLPVITLIILTGCGVSPRLTELREGAESAIENEDYTTALQSYEELIELQKSRNREISGEIWHYAGIAAWELDETDKAIEYLVQAGKKRLFNRIQSVYSLKCLQGN
jgi:tetratricopeptide (TPR) repeat protein